MITHLVNAREIKAMNAQDSIGKKAKLSRFELGRGATRLHLVCVFEGSRHNLCTQVRALNGGTAAEPCDVEPPSDPGVRRKLPVFEPTEDGNRVKVVFRRSTIMNGLRRFGWEGVLSRISVFATGCSEAIETCPSCIAAVDHAVQQLNSCDETTRTVKEMQAVLAEHGRHGHAREHVTNQFQ